MNKTRHKHSPSFGHTTSKTADKRLRNQSLQTDTTNGLCTFFLLNGRTQIIKASTSAQRLLRSPEESLINSTLLAFINNEYKLKFHHHILQVLASDEEHACQVEIINLQGEKVKLTLKSQRLYNEEHESFLAKTIACEAGNSSIFDKAAAPQQVKRLTKSQRFIEFISKKSTALINAKPQTLKTELAEIFQFICTHIKAEAVYIYFLDTKQKCFQLEHLWPARHSRNAIKKLIYTEFPEYFDELTRNESIRIFTAEEFESYGLEKLAEKIPLMMHIAIPIFIQKNLTGIMGFDFDKNKPDWDRRLNDELILTSQIISNTIERSNNIQELILAKQKAEESDNLKSAFLANLSHEIRTPLNGIMGFSEILEKMKIPDEKQHEYLRIIRRSSKQLLSVIEDILDISKIESNQIKVHPLLFNLNNRLDELVRIYNDPVKNPNLLNVTSEKALKNSEAYLESDESLLKRILSALLDNAIKFTESGRIKFGYEIENNRILKFFVKDTGIGIDEKYKHAIFDHFRQLEETETREYGGTGLGLTIAKSFVELLGGNIWVESELNYGSHFYFTLPNKISTSKRKDEEELPFENAWVNHSILIVDDNDDIHTYLKEIFAETGARFISAYNGKQAIEKVEKSSVDLVLLDLQMPKLNGFETCKKIKHYDAQKPVIIQTAYSDPADVHQARNAGCDELVTKPLDSSKLFAIISKHLKLG